LAEASYKVETQGDVLRLRAEGDWSVTHVLGLDAELRRLGDEGKPAREAVFDMAGVTRLDTAGAWMLDRTAVALEARGAKARYDGLREEHRILLDKIGDLEYERGPRSKRPRTVIEIVERIGAGVTGMWDQAVVGVAFLGEVMRTLGAAINNPRRLRLIPLVHHMEKAGFDALPLVCLLTFLIGAVIAQQGASQLQKFGAEAFTVNLITIVFLREVGLLLTAIIVAGRSGSAFTAEIGSMKMREEIDAMRTLGLDPMEMLVLPRVLALIFVLPLLTFVADIMGLIGGGVVAMTQLNMAPMVYIERLRSAADFWTFGVGLLKAPFMALAIGLIGCRSGLDVTGSAESVGSQTTRSVVRSIFLVIILDAVFAMFFTAVGI
jgi:phospholipid/cholesterol/gamma-HCH transport system permease protein